MLNKVSRAKRCGTAQKGGTSGAKDGGGGQREEAFPKKEASTSSIALRRVVVQSPGPVQLPVTPWTAARQASLPSTTSWSSLKLMSIESMMPSNHLILCHPLLLLPSVFPNIRLIEKGKQMHPWQRGKISIGSSV